MGLPEDWSTVEEWFVADPPFFKDNEYEKENSGNKKALGKTMPDHFWKTFPKRALPDKPTTRVNIKQ
jgi:hypothetical protein